MEIGKEILVKLKAPFPKEQISWRSQMLSKDGTKAMALAYIDSRDVRDRLDDVCGAENWQSEHYDCGGGKLACRIGIKINGEWVWKSDGAGDTDVEAEKGAFSDALKRAAVSWGIGRYLYDFKTPWVPCDTYTNSSGKKVWSGWSKSPWEFVSEVNEVTNSTICYANIAGVSVAFVSYLDAARGIYKAMKVANVAERAEIYSNNIVILEKINDDKVLKAINELVKG